MLFSLKNFPGEGSAWEGASRLGQHPPALRATCCCSCSAVLPAAAPSPFQPAKVNSTIFSSHACNSQFLFFAANLSLFQVFCRHSKIQWRQAAEDNAVLCEGRLKLAIFSALHRPQPGTIEGHAWCTYEAAQFSDAHGSWCFSSTVILFKGW